VDQQTRICELCIHFFSLHEYRSTINNVDLCLVQQDYELYVVNIWYFRYVFTGIQKYSVKNYRFMKFIFDCLEY